MFQSMGNYFNQKPKFGSRSNNKRKKRTLQPKNALPTKAKSKIDNGWGHQNCLDEEKKW